MADELKAWVEDRLGALPADPSPVLSELALVRDALFVIHAAAMDPGIEPIVTLDVSRLQEPDA